MNDGDTISENITNLYGDGSYGNTKTVVAGTGKQTENFTTAVINHGKKSQGYILKHGIAKENPQLSLTESVKLNMVQVEQMHNKNLEH